MKKIKWQIIVFLFVVLIVIMECKQDTNTTNATNTTDATDATNTDDNFEFLTVNKIVKSIKERFAEIECYSADFKITSEKMGKKTLQTGRIRTLAPNRILVEFWNPSGQKIVSDGKAMWVYIPALNVVAEQDLDGDAGGLLSANSKSGLTRLFSKYHYKFSSKEQPQTEKDGKKYYTLTLRQKESRSGFKDFKLWVGEDFLIRRAEGETSAGKKVAITFTKIRTDQKFKKGIFKFDIPSRARVIKNPMISEE